MYHVVNLSDLMIQNIHIIILLTKIELQKQTKPLLLLVKYIQSH